MIRYLDGNELADKLMVAIRSFPADGPVTLAVKGDGPFRRQIERMAKGTAIRVADLDRPVDYRDDLDTTTSQRVWGFFTDPTLSGLSPCVVKAIEYILKYSGLHDGITVLGRGRFGVFVATFCARAYGRVIWQSASDPIERPGTIINCSRDAPESYPDGSTVIDINKIGRLTTACLLKRALVCGYGEIELV